MQPQQFGGVPVNQQALAAYRDQMKQAAATQAANAKSRAGGGGRLILRFEFKDQNIRPVRFFTGMLASPRIKVHEKRNGNTLEWVGKCMSNWVGAPPCRGCIDKVKQVELVIAFGFDYLNQGQTVRNNNTGNEYPADVLRRLVRRPTQVPAFYSADGNGDGRIIRMDYKLTQLNDGNNNTILYEPIPVPMNVPNGQGGMMQVMALAESNFDYRGDNKQVLQMLQWVYENNLPAIYDLALR